MLMLDFDRFMAPKVELLRKLNSGSQGRSKLAPHENLIFRFLETSTELRGPPAGWQERIVLRINPHDPVPKIHA